MRLKHILVKIIGASFERDAVKYESIVFRAPPGKLWDDTSREQIETRVADYLERKYPTIDFQMVEVGKIQLNFVPVGEHEEATIEGCDWEHNKTGGPAGMGGPEGPH